MTTISLDTPPVPSMPRRLAGRARAAFIGASIGLMIGTLLSAAVGFPAPPAAVPPPELVELRIDGNGVGQLARVWTDEPHDVPAWGWVAIYNRPRAALYVVQAGSDAGASCSILVGGRVVSSATAGPLESVTCWWVAGP